MPNKRKPENDPKGSRSAGTPKRGRIGEPSSSPSNEERKRDIDEQANSIGDEKGRGLSASKGNKSDAEKSALPPSKGKKKPESEQLSYPDAKKKSASPVPKERIQAKKDGDCAFHAIFGEPDAEGVLVCSDAKERRAQVAAALREIKPDTRLYSLAQEGVQALIMSGQNLTELNYIEALSQAYQQFSAGREEKLPGIWEAFKRTLDRFPDIIQYITDCARDYPGLQSGQNISFRNQFCFALNCNKDRLHYWIASLPELDEAFKQYNRLSNAGFDWQTGLSPEVLDDYAKFISQPGQWLLPCELDIVARVFETTVHFYPAPDTEPQTYNPGQVNSVTVQFDGINHFDRLTPRGPAPAEAEPFLAELERRPLKIIEAIMEELKALLGGKHTALPDPKENKPESKPKVRGAGAPEDPQPSPSLPKKPGPLPGLPQDIAIPVDYCCPISHQLMYDPVVAADGQTYEREGIERWLETNLTSPITGAVLAGTSLTSNVFAKKMIHEYIDQHPALRDSAEWYLPKARIQELAHACAAGDEKAIQALISQDRRLLVHTFEHGPHQGKTALHLAAAGHPRALQTVIGLLEKRQKGLSLTALLQQDGQGWLPFHHALFAGQEGEMLLQLLGWMGKAIEQLRLPDNSPQGFNPRGLLAALLLSKQQQDLPKLQCLQRLLAATYQLLAEQGHAEAQYALAKCYFGGEGVSQDDAKMLEWCRRAAAQNHIEAQYLLAHCYCYGRGVEQDEKEAMRRYLHLAEQGHAAAQLELGNLCFRKGDHDQAAKWYFKAAVQGQATAQYNFGTCLESGRGVARNEKEAVMWYQKAAAQGNEGAKLALARRCGLQLGVNGSGLEAKNPGDDKKNERAASLSASSRSGSMDVSPNSCGNKESFSRPLSSSHSYSSNSSSSGSSTVQEDKKALTQIEQIRNLLDEVYSPAGQSHRDERKAYLSQLASYEEQARVRLLSAAERGGLDRLLEILQAMERAKRVSRGLSQS